MKAKLMELTGLCIEKEIIIYIIPASKSVDVYTTQDGVVNWGFNSYYEGPLKNLESGKTLLLDNLIAKVKEYKN